MSALEGLSAGPHDFTDRDGTAEPTETQDIVRQTENDPDALQEPLVNVGDRVKVTTPDGGGFSFSVGNTVEIYGVPCLVGMHSPVYDSPLERRGTEKSIERTHLMPGTLVAVPIGELESVSQEGAKIGFYLGSIGGMAAQPDWRNPQVESLDVWRLQVERTNTVPVEGQGAIISVFEFEWGGPPHPTAVEVVGSVATMNSTDLHADEAAA